MQIIPEDKMKQYIKYCRNKKQKTTVFCDNCMKTVDVDITPYFYDEDNNDVYFASICPICGKLMITKE